MRKLHLVCSGGNKVSTYSLLVKLSEWPVACVDVANKKKYVVRVAHESNRVDSNHIISRHGSSSFFFFLC